MAGAEVNIQLSHSQAEATDLRTKLFMLQKDLVRTEKRLTKANATSTKLEGLLLQTEGEADTLRAQYADAKIVAENARKDEANLLAALDESEKRVQRIQEEVGEREKGLKRQVEQREGLVGELMEKVCIVEAERGQIEDALKNMVEMVNELKNTVLDKEADVQGVKTEIEKLKGGYDEKLQFLHKQRDEEKALLEERERKCENLGGRLENAVLTVSNLELRLIEVQFDADNKLHQLEAALVGKEGEVQTVSNQLAEKNVEFQRLVGEKAQIEDELAERVCQRDDIVSELKKSEQSLLYLKNNLEGQNATVNQGTSDLQASLSAKVEELTDVSRLLEEQSALHEERVIEFSRMQQESCIKLNERREEISMLSSRLEVSQTALQELQHHYSESIRKAKEKERELVEALAEKEGVVDDLRATLEICDRDFNNKLLMQAGELSNTMKLLAEKEEELQAIWKRLQDTEALCEEKKSDLAVVSKDYAKMESELQSQLLQKEAEMGELKASLEVSNREKQTLFCDLDIVNKELQNINSGAQESLLKLQSELAAAKNASAITSKECVELQTLLNSGEETVEQQKMKIKDLYCELSSQEYKRRGLEESFQATKTENIGLEKQLKYHVQHISEFEKEKLVVSADLQTILAEREEMASQINELQRNAKKLVEEAQEDAASEISELRTKYEELEQQLQRKVEDAELLAKQLAAKESVLDSNIIGLKQCNAQISRYRDEVRSLDDRERKLKAEIAARDSLLDRSTEESCVLLKRLEQSVTESSNLSNQLRECQNSEKNLKSAYRLLLQRLEEVHTVCGLEAVLDSYENDSYDAIHQRANRIILELDEHARGCRYLEDEMMCKLEKQGELDDQLKKKLLAEKSDLQKSLDQRKQHLQEKEQEIQDANNRVEEGRAQLSIANGKIQELNQSKQTLCSTLEAEQSSSKELETKVQEQEKRMKLLYLADGEARRRITKLEEHCSAIAESNRVLASDVKSREIACEKTMKSLKRKEDDLKELVGREQELRGHVHKYQQIAHSAAASLEEQERAAEITLASMQKHIFEQEASLYEMAHKYKDSEARACDNSRALEDIRVEKDQAINKLKELTDSHWSLTKTMNKQQEEARCIAENTKAKLITSEEAQKKLLAADEEKEEALEKAALENNSLQCELKAMQKALDEEVDQREYLLKRNMVLQNEAHETEENSQKAKAELEHSKSFVQLLQTEVESKTIFIETEVQAVHEKLSVEHKRKQELSEEQFRAKFEKASKSEDIKLSKLHSELQNISEEKESLAKTLDDMSSEHSREKAYSTSLLSDLAQRLEEAQAAMAAVQKQRDSMEVALLKREEEKDELVKKHESFQELVASKEKYGLGLSKKLEMADVSIKALEEKAKLLSEELGEADKKHKECMDDLLCQLDQKREEVNEAIKVQKKTEVVSEKRLSELERIMDVVQQLQKDEAVTRTTTAKLEQLVEEKSNEILRIEEAHTTVQAAFARKTEALVQAEQALETARMEMNSRMSIADQDLQRKREEELQRRAEWLALQAQKAGRKFRRVEKLLAAEKKKNKEAVEMSVAVAKRMVSPSTKGVSPALKRARDSGREPLSPMVNNSSRPLHPRVGSGARLF